MSNYQKTMGPVVVKMDGSDEMVAKCYSGRFDCAFRIGAMCTYSRPSRKLDGQETPDWCEMKGQALADAEKMAAQQ